MLNKYRHGKSLAALAAATTALVGFAVVKPPLAGALLNPLALSAPLFLVLYAAKCASLAAIDAVVGWYLERTYATRPLPYRGNVGAVGLERLEWIDSLYLAINSVIEFVFSAHVFKLALDGQIVWRPSDLGPLNTLPALYLIFAIDDAFYAPTHYLMHHPLLYAFIHKHHHRQNLPERGYLDAGNEHPVEQVIGLSCLWATLQVVARMCGVHALTILIHFLMYAVLALLNHTNYDVQFRFFGFEYAVRSHETHHRYPQTNLAQYFMVWDKLMGTYKPYYDGLKTSKTDLKSLEPTKPKAL